MNTKELFDALTDEPDVGVDCELSPETIANFNSDSIIYHGTAPAYTTDTSNGEDLNDDQIDELWNEGSTECECGETIYRDKEPCYCIQNPPCGSCTTLDARCDNCGASVDISV